MPVLWINSIGMRRPQLGQGRDVRRILARVGVGLRHAEVKENLIRVLSPVVIPKATSAFSQRINRFLMGNLVRREIDTLSKADIEAWLFVPNSVDYLGVLGESKIIYYCVDDWTLFPNLDGEWISQCEKRLLQVADVVFATSRFLERKCRGIAGDRVHYLPHGVNYSRFATALDQATIPPNDITRIPVPRIGYYGNIREWLDFQLLNQLASSRPNWNFVMIGPISCDISGVSCLPNVHFLGRREPEQLPAYCRAFDVAMIPYRADDSRMEAINPVKLRELLAAGVPVVASPLPEVQGVSDSVVVAKTAADFIRAIEQFLVAITVRPDFRNNISLSQKDHDWTARVREIRRIVDAVSTRD